LDFQEPAVQKQDILCEHHVKSGFGIILCVAAGASPFGTSKCKNWAFATEDFKEITMAKIAKTADRKKVMDTTKSTNCPKCGKETRIVKRVKDRERNVPGGIFISCAACDFYEKL
jgi:hypothetical protein